MIHPYSTDNTTKQTKLAGTDKKNYQHTHSFRIHWANSNEKLSQKQKNKY